MRSIITAIIAVSLISSLSVDATTHKVPQDFAKIQLAINAAVNGDTILVSEGTYTENIVIAKKIVLGSLFLLDHDTSHVSKTIINGSTPTHADTGATVTCIPGSATTTHIVGLTITGGKGNKHAYTPTSTWIEGGGIDVMSGGATIRHNIVRNNDLISFSDSLAYGGISAVTLQPLLGISEVLIEDNQIFRNTLSAAYAEGGGIGIFDSKAKIKGNRIENNSVTHSGGIAVMNLTIPDTVFIEQNLIQGNIATKNLGGITFAGSNAKGVIRNNTIIDNAATSIGGIGIGWSAYAHVDRNYIARNSGGYYGGIYFWNSAKNSIITNNIIIANVGDGITTNLSSSALIVNNTVVGNSRYGINTNTTSVIRALNNIIWSNSIGSIGGNVFASYNLVGGGYSGDGNIDVDPAFIPTDSVYRLTDTSKCISGGRQNASLSGIVLQASSTDFLGLGRPRPDSTIPDLGAVEHNSGWKIVNDIKELNLDAPAEFALLQSYPNPFNPVTHIRFALPSRLKVTVTIHDLLGRIVATLVNEEHSAGWKEVKWNASTMASGIYFYKLKAGSFTEMKKMMLMK